MISLYSKTSIQGTPSESREVSREWRMGWGLLIINQHYFYSASESAAVVFFMQLDNV